MATCKRFHSVLPYLIYPHSNKLLDCLRACCRQSCYPPLSSRAASLTGSALKQTNPFKRYPRFMCEPKWFGKLRLAETRATLQFRHRCFARVGLKGVAPEMSRFDRTSPEKGRRAVPTPSRRPFSLPTNRCITGIAMEIGVSSMTLEYQRCANQIETYMFECSK